jgi:serine/threonine protein kinase
MLSDEVVAHLKSVAAFRYELVEEIGRGGMGVVYLAEDLDLGRRVALKVLNSLDLEEARTLAALEHPGIVPVYDSGTMPDGRVFYAMRLVDGTRLDRYRDTPAGLLRVFQRICETVAFAHARGVAHRDLKPPNIMVGKFGEVLVLDWGVPGVSTKGYAPPEGAGELRGDVYALGKILETLIGTNAPRTLRSIQMKASAATQAERYTDAGALARDVAAYLDGAVVEAHREMPWEWTARWLRRNRAWVGLVAAYGLARIILIFWFPR